MTQKGAFDPYRLAELYGVTIVRMSELDLAAKSHFLDQHQAVFSGALIPVGTGAVILENDAHSSARSRMTLSHELSHLLLEHQFSNSLVDEDGCRSANSDDEAEATHLAGELVLPSSGALDLAWNNASDEEAAASYQISVRAAAWRMNASGARLIVKRARARRGYS
ncbi:ImmA/IrrE family metallo-endopeptidase [Pseudarthrobacter sp. NPDC058329]|uniref:ImmA/IrrE family metallo-endopeptidase n=1 Tax=Pseudarthrobacter sp. NPDC058329 TaxID=3346448 RepID=UPI0036DBCC7C